MPRDLSALRTNHESLRHGTGDQLHTRAHALEEVFFAKRERELLHALRQKMHYEELVKDLAGQLGIADLSTAEALAKCGIEPQTLSALVLAPLVEIAWADGELDAFERESLVAEALRHRVVPDSPAWRLLQSWLAEPPPESLFEAWADYANEFSRSVPREERDRWSTGVVELARSIIDHARRTRHFNLSRCVNELRVMDRIEAALDASGDFHPRVSLDNERP